MNWNRFIASLPAAINRQKITSQAIWEVIFFIYGVYPVEQATPAKR